MSVLAALLDIWWCEQFLKDGPWVIDTKKRGISGSYFLF